MGVRVKLCTKMTFFYRPKSGVTNFSCIYPEESKMLVRKRNFLQLHPTGMFERECYVIELTNLCVASKMVCKYIKILGETYENFDFRA